MNDDDMPSDAERLLESQHAQAQLLRLIEKHLSQCVTVLSVIGALLGLLLWKLWQTGRNLR